MRGLARRRPFPGVYSAFAPEIFTARPRLSLSFADIGGERLAGRCRRPRSPARRAVSGGTPDRRGCLAVSRWMRATRLPRRAGGKEQAEPGMRLDFRDSRARRRSAPAGRAASAAAPPMASALMRPALSGGDRGGDAGEGELHLAGDHRGNGERDAFVGNVHQIDAGLVLQHLAGEVRLAAAAVGSVVDAAGFGLCRFNQALQVVERRGRMRHQELLQQHQHRHRQRSRAAGRKAASRRGAD